MIVWITFGIALLLSWLFIPVVRKYSFRYGLVAFPRVDRWHRLPTPTMGGVAIFSAFAISLLLAVCALTWKPEWLPDKLLDSFAGGMFLIRSWGFLLGAVLVFGLGVYDDLKPLSPPAKLIGQIIAAAIVVSTGTITNFFTPRLDNHLIALILNILVSIVWLVGITNAINLLDNMDGLAGGISLITAILLGYLFWEMGNIGLVIVSAALVGSILSFLFYNFPPAKIFMGDSGSMFLGFTLASLAIARQPQASNVFAVLGVPTLLFLLPIIDTVLVTITRLLRGESPVRGGLDHTSHRLVAFGLKEHQVLWVLYSIALLSGVLAITFEAIGYWLSVILIPVFIIGLALVAAYLGGLKIHESSAIVQISSTGSFPAGQTNPIAQVMLDLTFKRRLFEVLLDFGIIFLAFYLAFITLYGIYLSELRLLLFTKALPAALSVTYLAFFLSGVYRGVWRYVGVNDFVHYLKAALGSLISTGIVVYLWYFFQASGKLLSPFEAYAPGVFIFYGLYLFAGLAISRSSFKILDRFANQQPQPSDERILIYGASDLGEMALRWILMNPELHYRTIGFLDDNPLKAGRSIHGIRVLGDFKNLDQVLKELKIDGIIFTEPTIASTTGLDVKTAVGKYGCWVRNFHLGFDELE